MVTAKGRVIGWEDILQGRNNTINVRCLSPKGVLILIDGEEFLRKVMDDVDIVEHFANACSEKDKQTFKIIRKNNTALKASQGPSAFAEQLQK